MTGICSNGGALTPEVRFVYKPTPEVHTAGTCIYPQNCLHKGMWLVSEVGVKANVSRQAYPDGFNRRLFSYQGGRFDVRGRGWLGFAETTVTDEQTGTTTTTTYDNTSTLSDSAYTYRYPGALRPVDVTTEVDARMVGEANGNKRRLTTHYQYRDEVVPGYCPCAISSNLSEVRSTDEEASVQGATILSYIPVKSSRSRYDHNPYGLVVSDVEERFEGGFEKDGTPPVVAKVKKLQITRIPSPIDQTNWLIRRYESISATATEPARAAVNASPANPATPAVPEQVVSRTIALGWRPDTMAIDKITVEPYNSTDTSLYSVTDFIRDDPAGNKTITGNITKINVTADDGRGQTTRTFKIDWDILDRTLPYRITNPLQQVETLFYHAGLGRLAVLNDVNGLRTVVKFDRFGRRRVIDRPSAADTSIDYALSGSLLTITRTQASGEIARQSINKWGRTVFTEESRLNGIMAVVENTFTRRNQLATTTFPHYESSQDLFAFDTAYLDFAYDNLGRIRKRRIFDSNRLSVQPTTPETETWTYDGLVQHYVNARGIEINQRDRWGLASRSNGNTGPPSCGSCRIPCAPTTPPCGEPLRIRPVRRSRGDNRSGG